MAQQRNAQESVDVQSISWARERFPALHAKVAQARLKPSISWPIPVLRWKAIASVRAIIHPALKGKISCHEVMNALPQCLCFCPDRESHEWSFAARPYLTIIFFPLEYAAGRASFLSFHRSNPRRT